MTHKGIDIDDKLWKDFGKKCVNNDTTIKKKLPELVERYLKEG